MTFLILYLTKIAILEFEAKEDKVNQRLKKDDL